MNDNENAVTKVMVISTVGLIYDGITGIILSYLEGMDREGLEIYVAGTISVHQEIRSRIENLGCHVVDLPSRRTDTVEYICRLISFLRQNNVSVMHAHGNSGTLAIEMVAGWLGGCKKRIAHSHNTHCDQVKVDRILRPIFNTLYTDALACGEEAGEWLFGNRPFIVLRNGRSIEKYEFNKSVRADMRSKYGISDRELVIGHVGHFTEQKNQSYAIDVFRALLCKEPNARLYLIGDGPLRESVENYAQDLRDHVTFVGTTGHVEDYLQMMDVMILPSLFEGFPLVSVEWQINGLPAVIADTVTRKCALTELVQFKPLDPTLIDDWARCLIDMAQHNDRAKSAEMASKMVIAAGYNIVDNAAILRGIYLNEQ